MKDLVDIRDGIEASLRENLEENGQVLVRMYSVVESMDMDGDLQFTVYRSDNNKHWHRIGMLSTALEMERHDLPHDDD